MVILSAPDIGGSLLFTPQSTSIVARSATAEMRQGHRVLGLINPWISTPTFHKATHLPIQISAQLTARIIKVHAQRASREVQLVLRVPQNIRVTARVQVSPGSVRGATRGSARVRQ